MADQITRTRHLSEALAARRRLAEVVPPVTDSCLATRATSTRLSADMEPDTIDPMIAAICTASGEPAD